MDEDLLLAIKLSEEEANQKAQESQGNTETDLDKDFLLALKIQNDFESQQYARHLAEKERLNLPNPSKVALSWDISYTDKYEGHQYYSQVIAFEITLIFEGL